MAAVPLEGQTSQSCCESRTGLGCVEYPGEEFGAGRVKDFFEAMVVHNVLFDPIGGIFSAYFPKK